ncbi:head completion/stabilization protein [Spartinivicinus ruber]|uniref:head completion/stabilization protein n=1 Tax=Spartinivicinus ruber TaxID=2683272 RepID=UPI0013D206AB|nr:head completion/stabilization protein [Spartinivicinus ruber]
MSIHDSLYQPATGTITSDDFFPAVSVGEFQQLYRLHEYTEDLIESELIQAVIAINSQLDNFKATLQAKGINQLADKASPNVGGQHRDSFLYQRAVMSLAKANVLQQYQVIFTSEKAEHVAKTNEETYDFWLAVSQRALSQLQDQPLITVELL